MALSDKTKYMVEVALANKAAGKELCDAIDAPQLTADITLSQAQFQALFTTPRQIIPAPGAGLAVVVDALYGVNEFDTAAFEAGTQTLDVGYAGGATLVSLTNAFVEAAATKRSYVLPAVAQFDPAVNTGVVVRLASADATGGGTNSKVKLRVRYRILPSSL